MSNMDYTLSNLLFPYTEKNSDSKYEPAAVGKYGIRKRSEIYKKELSSDYSKNKVIYKDTLTIGLGSNQIDIGILTDSVIYSVSPAYSTFKINTEVVRSAFLELYFEVYNDVLTKRYMISSARQGKKVDITNLLKESITIPSLDLQDIILKNVKLIKISKDLEINILKLYDELMYAKFIEMFGHPTNNSKDWEYAPLSEKCEIVTGNTPSRRIAKYYGDYIEWIKSDNINTPHAILTTAEEYLSEEGLKVGRFVNSGSILMTCIAGSIGCIGNVAIANRTVSFNQQINAIIPGRNNTWFMYYLFKISQKTIQETISISLKGIISKGKLSQMKFIFPPIKLQNEFGDYVEYIEKLKVFSLKRVELNTELLNKILYENFNLEDLQ